MAFLVCWAPHVSAQTLEPIGSTVSSPRRTRTMSRSKRRTDRRTRLDRADDGSVDAGLVSDSRIRAPRGSADGADPARAPLAIEKTRKNRWRVATNGAGTVWVRYRVYAHDMSVRTNWVDEEFALINGAPTFITLVESPSRRRHDVRVVLPRAWAEACRV